MMAVFTELKKLVGRRTNDILVLVLNPKWKSVKTLMERNNQGDFVITFKKSNINIRINVQK